MTTREKAFTIAGLAALSWAAVIAVGYAAYAIWPLVLAVLAS